MEGLLAIAAASQLQLLRGFSSRSAEDGLSGLSIGELKKLLSERGVDYRDCLEKNDLVARLKASSTGVCVRPSRRKADPPLAPSLSLTQTTSPARRTLRPTH